MKIDLTKYRKEVKTHVNLIIEKLIELQQLRDEDSLTISLLCDHLETYYSAKEKLNGEYVITNAQGNLVSHPLVKIVNEAQKMVNVLTARLPLSPLQRKQCAKKQEVSEESSPLDEFIG